MADSAVQYDDEINFSDPDYPYGVVWMGGIKLAFMSKPSDDNQKVECKKIGNEGSGPDQHVFHCKHFVNAKEMAAKNPDTFHCPSEEDLNGVEEGQTVKVCHNGERFWTVVQSVEKNTRTLIVKVDNSLVRRHPFGNDSLLRVHLDELFATESL